MTRAQLLQRISEELQATGVPTNLSGYLYLREAVARVYEDRGQLRKMMFLYEAMAKIDGNTPSGAERAMRHAIEVAWAQKKGSERFNRPAVNHFLSDMADRLYLENLKNMVVTSEAAATVEPKEAEPKEADPTEALMMDLRYAIRRIVREELAKAHA